MIADLVGGKAGGGRHGVGQLVKRGRGVGVERIELAFGNHRRETRPGLDRQFVEREMAGAEADGALERRCPALFGVAGKRIDEVETDAFEPTLRGFERMQPFARAMRAAEKAQGLVVEALETEREPVDAGYGEIGEARRLDRVGIRFERDLEVVGRVPVGSRGIDHGRDRRRLHQRRGAPAKENRGQPAPGKKPRLMREVGEQGSAPHVLVDGRPDMAVEVAIRAFADAERPVHVERDVRVMLNLVQHPFPRLHRSLDDGP